MRKQSISSRGGGGGIPALEALLALVFILGIIFLIVSGPRLFGSAPELSLQTTSQKQPLGAKSDIRIGQKVDLTLIGENQTHGVCYLSMTMVQADLQKEIVSYRGSAGSWFLSWKRPWQKQVSVPAIETLVKDLGFSEGPAKILIKAQDCSFWHRESQFAKDVQIDFTPPRISLTSSQHYVNQGGADVVTYTVSPDAVWSGVQVGPYQFKGYKKPGAPENSSEYFAFFVFSYDMPPETPIELIAIDAAGNQGKATLIPSKFFPKEFRHRDIAIDDNFIETKVADIISQTPSLKNLGNNLQNFLSVNHDLRKVDAKFLVDLAKKSEPVFFWKDAFRPLANAAVEANFADYRNYTYQGQKVDEQVHLGFDLAVVEKNPILASGNGKVIYADYLGIYGNVVVIDHGYGLFTLYAHLSSIDVKVGDVVARDQKIANSGATGLAAGDHLHYSMLIQGVQTNPVEFWDQHWIDDHVYLRLGRDAFGK